MRLGRRGRGSWRRIGGDGRGLGEDGGIRKERKKQRKNEGKEEEEEDDDDGTWHGEREGWCRVASTML